MAVGNGYSSAQILAMQKDAIRRVNEMQRFSQERLHRTQEAMGDVPAPVPPQSSSPGHGQGESRHTPSNRQGEPMHMPDHRFNRTAGNNGQSGQVQGYIEHHEPEEHQAVQEQQETPQRSEAPFTNEPQAEEQTLPICDEVSAVSCGESITSSPENPLKGILDRLGLDKETTLVLLLLLMLVNEGADSKLIMALVYILL